MMEKVFKYEIEEIQVHEGSEVLETTEIEGIFCSWTAYTDFANNYNDHYAYRFIWNFDWTKLKNEGVDRLTGHLIVKLSVDEEDDEVMEKIDIDWREGKKTISESILSWYSGVYAVCEYHLTAHYTPQYTQIEKISYDEMFAASEMNDTILVIEGKKLYVNKMFLSYHSEFFRVLFSSNFKEGQMTEIPIKEVSYEDFGLLLSTIYPDQVFPNERQDR